MIKIIIALDNLDPIEALELAGNLYEHVDGFKTNHIMWDHPVVFSGKEFFMDCKLWDTPNTLKRVLEKIIEKGATMTTINTFNNPAALDAVSEFKDDIKLLGVAYLTSWSNEELFQIVQEMEPTMWRKNLARMKAHGFSGVISSAHDIDQIRKWGDGDHELLNVCPGITLPIKRGAPSGQVRITTPKEAKKLGADYLVIGRAITESKDPVGIVKNIREQLAP